MRRYHPALVALHWILAILIIVELISGSRVLSETLNSDPEKIFYLRMHMIVGLAILLLMVIRLVVRVSTATPPEADIGNALMNRLGRLAHYLFYIIVFLMVASGIGISLLAGLPEIVFEQSGAALPVSFDDLPPRWVHGALSVVMMLLIVGHVGAFLIHQFVRKDQLFSRMWFGSKE